MNGIKDGLIESNLSIKAIMMGLMNKRSLFMSNKVFTVAGGCQEWTTHVNGYMTPQVEALSSNVEAVLIEILAKQNEMIQCIRNEVASTTQGLHNLERQVEQLLSELREQYAEEDAQLEAKYHDYSTKDVKTPLEDCHSKPCQNEESPLIPCHVEEVGESSIIIPPSSKEHDQELLVEGENQAMR
ncbi:hypothetical protein ACLB2K_022296 [Fragaria x ananassa]